MSFDQLLSLAQTLKLSPSLLQSMNILQMNTQELSDYLNNLAMENPAMEYDEGHGTGPAWEEISDQAHWMTEPGIVQDQTESLDLFLRDQLSRLGLAPSLLALCQYLADSLDHQGRLDPDDLAGLRRAGVPEALLEEAVTALQSLDPPGIAARSLEECLALQLRRLPGDNTLAVRLCGHLEDLAKERYKHLAARLHTTEDEIKNAAQQVKSLDPDPLNGMTPAVPVQHIRPDAWVTEEDGQLQVFVNQWDLPRFCLSETVLQMARDGHEAETADYLRQNIRQAQWVLQCVQRRQTTLETCLTALVQVQRDYFLGKSAAPRPFLRRELAETLGVHPSTVTRALSNKYIQCRQGLFPAAFFFSRSSGGGFSEQALKARIAQIIQAEDPVHPRSDQAITEQLNQEGISLARRTVTKYRVSLGYPASHRRRRT